MANIGALSFPVLRLVFLTEKLKKVSFSDVKTREVHAVTATRVPKERGEANPERWSKMSHNEHSSACFLHGHESYPSLLRNF